MSQDLTQRIKELERRFAEMEKAVEALKSKPEQSVLYAPLPERKTLTLKKT